jgi:hypothetical protein
MAAIGPSGSSRAVEVGPRFRAIVATVAAFALLVPVLLMASAASAAVGQKSATPSGYDLVGADGGVFVFPVGRSGGFYGSLPGLGVRVNDVVGTVPTNHYTGYDLAGSDGGVFVFPVGQPSGFFGSLPGLGVSVNDVVGIVPTNNFSGYDLVGKDGGVFVFPVGQPSGFFGSLPGEGISVDNIVGIVVTGDDKGYWLAGSTGHIYNIGDAPAVVSPSTSSPVVGIAGDSTSKGGWLVAANGSVYPFGDTVSFGTLPVSGTSVNNIVSIVPTPSGAGYLIIGAGGRVYPFGDATSQGTLPALGVAVSDVVGAVPTGGTRTRTPTGGTTTAGNQTITQTTPFTASVTTTTSGSFSDRLHVTGATGTVSYTETAFGDSADVLVSSTGRITTRGDLAAGTYHVTGEMADTHGDTGTWRFTLHVTAPVILPVVSAISPVSGPPAGGTLVTVSGSGFKGVTTVSFGTAAGTTISVNAGGTQLTVKSPAGTEGASVNVRVTTPLGESHAVTAGLFTYGPIVTSISRPSGPVSGGTKVVITGSGFTTLTRVTFGTTAATEFTDTSPTSVIAFSPPHAAGQVRISVTTPTGTTPSTSADLYTYE